MKAQQYLFISSNHILKSMESILKVQTPDQFMAQTTAKIKVDAIAAPAYGETGFLATPFYLFKQQLQQDLLIQKDNKAQFTAALMNFQTLEKQTKRTTLQIFWRILMNKC
jgi:hypothetical protein